MKNPLNWIPCSATLIAMGRIPQRQGGFHRPQEHTAPRLYGHGCIHQPKSIKGFLDIPAALPAISPPNPDCTMILGNRSLLPILESTTPQASRRSGVSPAARRNRRGEGRASHSSASTISAWSACWTEADELRGLCQAHPPPTRPAYFWRPLHRTFPLQRHRRHHPSGAINCWLGNANHACAPPHFLQQQENDLEPHADYMATIKPSDDATRR